MTEQEATYTKDSVYANITFTTVPAEASEAIVKNGIDINCCKRAGYSQGFTLQLCASIAIYPKIFWAGFEWHLSISRFSMLHPPSWK